MPSVSPRRELEESEEGKGQQLLIDAIRKARKGVHEGDGMLVFCEPVKKPSMAENQTVSWTIHQTPKKHLPRWMHRTICIWMRENSILARKTDDSNLGQFLALYKKCGLPDEDVLSPEQTSEPGFVLFLKLIQYKINEKVVNNAQAMKKADLYRTVFSGGNKSIAWHPSTDRWASPDWNGRFTKPEPQEPWPEQDSKKLIQSLLPIGGTNTERTAIVQQMVSELFEQKVNADDIKRILHDGFEKARSAKKLEMDELFGPVSKRPRYTQ